MLKEKTVNISDLSTGDIEQMYQLMVAHYDNVQKDKFERDFFEKDGVLLVYDKLDRIVGFSTYQLIETVYKNQTVYSLFSGDTVLHREYWGKAYVYKIAGSIFKMLLEKNMEPLYWFLISKGYKTYLYLPLLFKKFYPCHFEETPEYEKGLISHLSKLRFGNKFCDYNGVIKENADKVMPEFNTIPDKKMQNKHVAHFAKLNSGFLKGEELACIAKIEDENLTDLGKRFIYG